MEAVLPLAAALTLLALAGGAAPGAQPGPGTAPQPARAAAGVRIVVAQIDIALTTPDRWRVSMASTLTELLLEGGSERAPLRLRVRRSGMSSTPREHMRAIAHELGHAGVEYQGEVTRQAGEREAVMLSAAGDDVHVRLFVTRLAPGGAEHLFWLEGGSRDVARAEDEVLACIGAATTAAAATTPGSTGSASTGFRHPQSGLVIDQHPVGLAPVSMTAGDLDAEGITWRAGAAEAPLASLSLSRRSVGPVVDETTVAASLGRELRLDPDVEELMSTRDRLAHRPARRMSWVRTGAAEPVAHETWIFKSGSSLFRLDLVARPTWLKENEAALAEFRRGLRFEE